jgi:hypothetical protein
MIQTAEVIYLSGPRNSYQEGPLGVIEVGAYSDKNFLIIMKDGKIYINTLITE